MPDDLPDMNAPVVPANTGNTADLPQWAREAISRANNEAATYRTQLRTKTEEHTAALGQIQVLTDAKTAAEAATASQALDALKLRTALTVGVPGDKAADFAELLKGDTEADIKAHAEKAFGLLNLTPAQQKTAVDPSQGLGAAGQILEDTPANAFAAQLRAGLDAVQR